MKKYTLSIILAILAIFVGFRIYKAQAVVTIGQPGGYPVPYLVTHDLFATTSGQTLVSDATTTDATSTNIVPYFDANGRLDNGQVNIAGAKKVTWIFSLTSTSSQSSSGTTTFTVQVSPDGINWYAWNKLTQDVATSTNQWEIGSVILSNSTTPNVASTTSSVNSMDLTYDSFYSVRCAVGWGAVTNGMAYCRALVTY